MIDIDCIKNKTYKHISMSIFVSYHYSNLFLKNVHFCFYKLFNVDKSFNEISIHVYHIKLLKNKYALSELKINIIRYALMTSRQCGAPLRLKSRSQDKNNWRKVLSLGICRISKLQKSLFKTFEQG